MQIATETNYTPLSNSRGRGITNVETVKNIQKYAPQPKKVYSTQMDEMRKCGLCYHCDEKWRPSHICKTLRVYLMLFGENGNEDKAEEVFYGSSEVALTTVLEGKPEISFNVLIGTPCHNTMRLYREIRSDMAVILVD